MLPVDPTICVCEGGEGGECGEDGEDGWCEEGIEDREGIDPVDDRAMLLKVDLKGAEPQVQVPVQAPPPIDEASHRVK